MAKVKKNRSYGLTDTIKELKAEYAETKQIPNPHRNQCYGWIFASLLALGKDKWHNWETFTEKVKETATGSKWQAFQRKEKRVEDGKSTAERLFQNALVLQRPDYGMKIFDLKNVIGGHGVVID